jgi:hypothetical protein
MTIVVEVSPEVEAELRAEAERHGMELPKYAGKILEDRRHRYATGTGVMTVEEVQALSARLSAGSENLPILPPEVNNRGSYYEDRS